MENISRGPTSGDFVTIRTEGLMQDVTVAEFDADFESDEKVVNNSYEKSY